MTSISRIARLVKLPERQKKKEDSKSQHKKREDESQERPVFPLKGNVHLKKPKTGIRRKISDRQTDSTKSAREGIGERLDLTV